MVEDFLQKYFVLMHCFNEPYCKVLPASFLFDCLICFWIVLQYTFELNANRNNNTIYYNITKNHLSLIISNMQVLISPKGTYLDILEHIFF